MVRMIPRSRRAVLLLAVPVALMACGPAGPGSSTGGPAAPGAEQGPPGTVDDGPAAAPLDEAPLSDKGVTRAACAQPAGGRATPGNGCIYLGVLSDFTAGPFAEFGSVVHRGQRDFWARVNAAGGVGGFDIDVDTYLRETSYVRADHAAAYREIEPEILLLAQSFGTPTTMALLSDLDADDVLAAPAGWWSGFHFKAESRGLALTSGYAYCLESMIGLDWFSENVRPVTGLAVIGYPGGYGEDVAQGARLWSEANEVPFVGHVLTGRSGVEVGDQQAAVQAVLNAGADTVVLGVGPQDAASIVGGVADAAPPGSILFLGSAPTWSPSLLGHPAAPALLGLYTNVSPWEDLTGSAAGHRAMRAAIGDTTPINQGYAAGWVWQYPVLAVLEAAAADGDLTRANLRALVDGLEVDYEGILPAGRLGGDPNANVNRTAVIGRVDPDTANGLSTVVDGYRGPTADAYAYTAACSG